MSSRLVKNGSQIEIPGDEVLVRLIIMKSGQMKLEAPMVHPKDLCKMLHNLSFDLMFASFQPTETSTIAQPTV